MDLRLGASMALRLGGSAAWRLGATSFLHNALLLLWNAFSCGSASRRLGGLVSWRLGVSAALRHGLTSCLSFFAVVRSPLIVERFFSGSVALRLGGSEARCIGGPAA